MKEREEEPSTSCWPEFQLYRGTEFHIHNFFFLLSYKNIPHHHQRHSWVRVLFPSVTKPRSPSPFTPSHPLFPCLPLSNTRRVTDGKASIGFLQPSEPAWTGRTALLTAKGWTPLCKPQRAGLVVRFPEPLTFGTWALRSPQNQSRSAER